MELLFLNKLCESKINFNKIMVLAIGKEKQPFSWLYTERLYFIHILRYS